MPLYYPPPLLVAGGDVTAASTITDEHVVRGDGGAKGVQESTVAIGDAGDIFPATDGVGGLGTSANKWSGLFLSLGAVIKMGSETLTHSAGVVTTTASWVFPAAGVTVGASAPFSDAAGTLTLQNVDALDSTTEATIEAAIDTLANLASIQGRTFTLGGNVAIGGALTINGALNFPVVAQGNLFYGSNVGQVDALAKDANATRYLSNTGTANNPAWAQVNLANGVTGSLAVTNLAGGAGASALTFWRGDGTWVTPPNSGDLVGPAGATDNAVTRFDNTTGKLVQNSVVTIGDTGAMAGVITLTGDVIATNAQTRTGTATNLVVTPDDLAQRAKFSAHKNGTNQTAITDNTLTKITFGTEAFDTGAIFDTATSRVVPPASVAFCLIANVAFSSANAGDGGFADIQLYKNGSQFKVGTSDILGAATGTNVQGVWIDVPNGTDYYEVFARMDGSAGDKTVAGATVSTYFQGFQI